MVSHSHRRAHQASLNPLISILTFERLFHLGGSNSFLLFLLWQQQQHNKLTRRWQLYMRVTYLPTFLPTYLYIYLHSYLPIYLPSYLSTYLPTYLSTKLPIYLHLSFLSFSAINVVCFFLNNGFLRGRYEIVYCCSVTHVPRYKIALAYFSQKVF